MKSDVILHLSMPVTPEERKEAGLWLSENGIVLLSM